MLPPEMQAHVDALARYGAETALIWSRTPAERQEIDPDFLIALRDIMSGAIQAQVEDPDYDTARELLEERQREQPMTREQACAVLAEREGTPPEHLDACSTESLIAAARADTGQPCADCGKLVVYRDDDWHHVDTPTSCFLARQDER